MQIEAKSYEHMLYGKEAEYIHRFYLPKLVRETLQVQDVSAFGLNIIEENMLMGEELVIHYQKENLVKTIPPEQVAELLTAHKAYWRDRYDKIISKEENCFLIALNERLKQLEISVMDQMSACQERLKEELKQGVFVKDFELEVVFDFYLAESDPDYDDNDDNILYQTTTWFAPLPGTVEENQTENSELSDVFKVQHCQLFHDLLEHSPVPLKHFCHIETIWTDIRSIRQNIISFCNGRQRITP